MKQTELINIAETWFDEKSWTAFPFQKKTWKAFLQGKHGLLNAPTGSGKTYALWVPIVLNQLQNPKTQRAKSHMDYSVAGAFRRNTTSRTTICRRARNWAYRRHSYRRHFTKRTGQAKTKHARFAHHNSRKLDAAFSK